MQRQLRVFALLCAVALALVVAPAIPGSRALADELCPMRVTVTDPADSYAPNQLRTAIAEVCDGGTVVIDESLATVDVGGPRIEIYKTVTVAGSGQTTALGFTVASIGDLTVKGLTFTGGPWAAFLVSGRLALENVTASGYGFTAIAASAGSVVTLGEGTLLTGNVGSRQEGGAGIYIDGGTVILNDDAAVTDNIHHSCYQPSAPYPQPPTGHGAGIFVKNGGSLTLNDQAVVSGNLGWHCDASRDTYGGNGGGIAVLTGSVTLNDSAQVSGNAAASAGGIVLYRYATLTINDQASVSGNYSNASGGGVRMIGASLTLRDTATISGNTATSNGGGVNNASGVVTLEDSASITGNTGANGGGVYNWSVGGSYSDPELNVGVDASISGNTPNDVVP